MTLRKGENRVRFVSTSTGKGEAVYLRFHDPDRKLRYPDVGHTYTPEMRKEMLAWFDKWLK